MATGSLALPLLLAVVPARADGGGDARAIAVEERAMDEYLAMRIPQAAKRLEWAISACGEAGCSRKVRAHLHLSLGFVYGAGNKDLNTARDEFAKALRIDKGIALDPDMQSREVSRAFRDAQADVAGAAPAAPTPSAPPERPTGSSMVGSSMVGSSNDSLFGPPSDPGPPVAPSRRRAVEGQSEPEPHPAFPHESIALFAAVDLGVLTSLSNVCSPGGPANWVCFDSDGTRYTGSPQPDLDNNNIKPGLGFSTVRIVAAYDHMLDEAWSVGFRLGVAMNGGPTPPGGSSFVPVHVEGRVARGFVAEPAPVVPFAFLSSGVEEVDTRVSVLVVEIPCANGYRNCARTLSAWRRAGFGFLGAGGGVRYAVSDHGAIVGDLRFALTFSSAAVVLTPELGYAYRF
jgi:hypothetical protein